MTKDEYLHRFKLNIEKAKEAGIEHIHYMTKLSLYVDICKPAIERLNLMGDIKSLTIEGPIGDDYGYVEFDLPLEAAIKLESDEVILNEMSGIAKM